MFRCLIMNYVRFISHKILRFFKTDKMNISFANERDRFRAAFHLTLMKSVTQFRNIKFIHNACLHTANNIPLVAAVVSNKLPFPTGAFVAPQIAARLSEPLVIMDEFTPRSASETVALRTLSIACPRHQERNICRATTRDTEPYGTR